MVDAKMRKNAQISMLKFKIFPGAVPEPPRWGVATVPLSKSHPLAPLALRRCTSPAPRSVPPAPQSSLQCLLAVDATGISFLAVCEPEFLKSVGSFSSFQWCRLSCVQCHVTSRWKQEISVRYDTIYTLCLKTVSYTHLTLPTNREV